MSQNIFLDELPSQFGPEFLNFRQCSWFSVICASRWQQFANAYNAKDLKAFAALYVGCLSEATNRKRASETYAHIETLFHPSILTAYSDSNLTLASFKHIHLNKSLESFEDYIFDQFPNAKEVKQQKLAFPESSLPQLHEDLQCLADSGRGAVVINRFSESFAAIPVPIADATVGGDGVFVVLDSHTTKVLVMTVPNLMRYIIRESGDANIIITYGIA